MNTIAGISITLMLLFFTACTPVQPEQEPPSASEPPPVEIVDEATPVEVDTPEEVAVTNAVPKRPPLTNTNPFTKINGEFLTITYESISASAGTFDVNLSIVNNKSVPQAVYLSDLRLINQTGKTIKPGEDDNKWALPGENEQFIFNGTIAGWQRFKNGIVYREFAAGEEQNISIQVNGNPDFEKYYYRLLMTLNGETFIITHPGK